MTDIVFILRQVIDLLYALVKPQRSTRSSSTVVRLQIRFKIICLRFMNEYNVIVHNVGTYVHTNVRQNLYSEIMAD